MFRSSISRIISLLLGLFLGVGQVQGQFYFGRNKVQYEEFNWQTLSTEHFDIYYYLEETQLAQTAAVFAEEAFDDLEIKFNHTLSRRVPLVIYSNHIHFQQTNVLLSYIPEGIGGFFEFIKGRVVLPYNGSMYDFRHVIRHELVHVFMRSKITRGIDQEGLWDVSQVPLWFSEGLAEWWSDGWDSQAEMVIRDALLYDNLIPLPYAGGYIVYKEGQSFLRYFEEQYGADRIRKLMEDYWLYDSFDQALGALSGKDPENVYLEWELAVKREAADALRQESVPPTGEQYLTYRGINVSPALYWDPTGKLHTVYLSNDDGFTNIISQELGKKDRHRVVSGERTADKESLHILQTGIDVNRQGQMAFVAKSSERDRIKLVDLSTGEELNQLGHPGLVSIRSPSWSPDGMEIVFSAQDYSGFQDLYLWEQNTSLIIKITSDAYSDQDPDFSPDGRWIVFSSDRGQGRLGRGRDLFLMNRKTQSLHSLTYDDNRNVKPYWDADHPEKIHFISDRSGTPNLWTLTLPDPENPDQGTGVMNRVTDLHTGIIEARSLPGDSLLLNTYQDYSFQFHQTKRSTEKASIPTVHTNTNLQVNGWQIPGADTGKVHMEEVPYRLKYSLDFAQTAVAYDPIYGFLGGAQLSMSDLMGNRYYHFLIANTAQTTSEFLGRFNLAVTFANLTKRSNLSFSAFHFANDYYDPYQAFYFERTVGVRGGLSYPFSVFRRLEFSTSLWHSSKDFYTGSPVTSWLLSNYLSLVHDNSLWTPIGPIDGWRVRITVGPTFDFQSSRLHSYVGLIDLRTYLRPWRNLTLAQRTMVWYNDGVGIRRFYIGGSWGIRGYALNEIYGRKFILLNQELRFPFANSLAMNFPTLSVGLAPIRGAIFLDVGNAWDRRFPGLKGSFGLGLRGAFMGAFILRLDVGKRTDFRTVSKSWFTQFFFGWDY